MAIPLAMPEPTSICAGALVVGGAFLKHVVEIAAAHKVVDGVEHALEHLHKRLQDGKLPQNHDIARASAACWQLVTENFIGAVGLSLAPEGRRSVITKWLRRVGEKIHLPADYLEAWSLDPHADWLEALRKAAADPAHIAALERKLVPSTSKFYSIVDRRDETFLRTHFTAAFGDWVKSLNLPGKPPLAIVDFLTNGWPFATDSDARILPYDAFVLCFNEHLKKDDAIFRITVTGALDDVRSDIRAVTGDVEWLKTHTLTRDEFIGSLDAQTVAFRAMFSDLAGDTPTERPIADYLAVIRKHYLRLGVEDALGEVAADYEGLTIGNNFIPQDARDCLGWVSDRIESPRDHEFRRPDGKSCDELPETVLAELEAHEKFHQAPLIPVATILEKEPRLVLIGGPGAGKSSLIRHALHCWAHSPDSAALPVPIAIDLRRFAVSGHRETFLDYLAKDPGILYRFPIAQLRGLIAADRAIFYFDGLDEIFDPADREKIARHIATFAHEHTSVRIVVTSRPVGYIRPPLRDAGFAHAMLADFDEPKIHDFITRWTTHGIDLPDDRAIVTQRLAAALATPSIRHFAGNPFLLTLMAVLSRRKALPRDITSLYKHATDLLIAQWDPLKNLPASIALGDVTVDEQDKIEVLRELAWDMQNNQQAMRGNLVSEEKIRAAWEAKLRVRIPDEGRRRQVITQVIEQLVARNYILCHVGAGHFAFVHRGFLEYFAAAWLLHLPVAAPDTAVAELKEIFKKRSKDEAWVEVLTLAGSTLDPAVSAQIIEHLVDGAEPMNAADAAYKAKPHPVRLACGCISRMREPARLGALYASIRQQIIQWTNKHFDYSNGEGWIILLADTWPDEETRTFLEEIIRRRNENTFARMQAVGSLAGHEPWRDERTRSLLEEIIRRDESTDARSLAVVSLAGHEPWRDERTRSLLEEIIRRDEDTSARRQAVVSLAGREPWRDDKTRSLLEEIIRRDENTHARMQAVASLAGYEPWRDEKTRSLLEEIAKTAHGLQTLRDAKMHFGNEAANAFLKTIVE